ncbi:PREDICTED: agamous-like MADS-box protein AGL80 isoform X2 [Camelina sativa]|uniref:Agamous-like MADS-box protein AGL80 isoform X2 n=1 Tax=Camelina sativa TaxID=90675 RepID=A0ABM1R3Z6_CAMSA|nr:PREDICTED: agamous-like MADS-box protein AGL80 isoform X2 [Camelina sativa]
MTRKKLNLSFIENDSMRKARFNKGKKGFVKKIHELSVLCGIEACAVIYSPSNSVLEVWPSNLGVKNVVEKFEMLTNMEQEKKMVNHEGFLKQNISKGMGNNKRKMKDNTERMMKEAMFELLGGKADRFKVTNKHREDLCEYIDQYLKELYHHKNKTLRQSHVEYGESLEAATNVMAPTSSVENANVNHLGHNQYQQQDGYPTIVPQYGIDNPSQNQGQQAEWLVSDDDLS